MIDLVEITSSVDQALGDTVAEFRLAGRLNPLGDRIMYASFDELSRVARREIARVIGFDRERIGSYIAQFPGVVDETDSHPGTLAEKIELGLVDHIASSLYDRILAVADAQYPRDHAGTVRRWGQEAIDYCRERGVRFAPGMVAELERLSHDAGPLDHSLEGNLSYIADVAMRDARAAVPPGLPRQRHRSGDVTPGEMAQRLTEAAEFLGVRRSCSEIREAVKPHSALEVICAGDRTGSRPPQISCW